MAAIAELKALATLDGKAFEAEITKLTGKTADFSSKLAGIKNLLAGAFSVGMIVNFAKGILQTADSLGDASDALGVSVENLQALRLAANEAGVGVEGMNDALGRIIRSQAEAVSGDDKLRGAFSALGISVEELAAMSPDQILEAVGQGFLAAGQSADATAAVFDIMGRSSARTLGLLKQLGSEGLDATKQKFKELGAIVSEETNKSLDETNQKLERTIESMKAFGAGALQKAISGVELVAGFAGALSAGAGIQEAAETAYSGSGFNSPMGGAAGAGRAPMAIGQSKAGAAGAKKDASEQARLERVTEQILLSEASATERLYYLRAQLAALDMATEDTAGTKVEFLERQLDLTNKLKQVESELLRDQEDGHKRALAVQKVQAGITAKRAELEAVTPIGAPSVDALKRIGGFIGGEADPAVSVAQRQLKIEEEVLKNLEQINERLRGTDAGSAGTFTE